MESVTETSADRIFSTSNTSASVPDSHALPNILQSIPWDAQTRELAVRPLPFAVNCEEAYPLLTGGAEYSFWLDSAREESPMSVASYVGVVPAQLSPLRVDSARAAAESGAEDPFAQLEAALARAPRVRPDAAAATGLPAGLRGGYVGYFGYEARAAMGLEHGHPVPGYLPAHEAPTPDSLWLPAVRYLVHEHARPGAAARSWLVGDEPWCEAAEQLLSAALTPVLSAVLTAAGERASENTPVNAPELAELLLFPAPAAEAYMDSVRASQHEIYEGNSYEVCLTAQTVARIPNPSPELFFELYRRQRAHNSAPYAAYLRCGDFSVLSSSPERFLSVDTHRNAQTKPIKGTIARGATPEEDAAAAAWLRADEKTRAENLMIVDLLRNDLSTVSDPASVRVPVLMGVESYSTVHQLVSTVSSRLREGVSAVAAARACFPGGSMTGAPKPSTMQIIEGLEGRARGVYSGALGFVSVDGSANLSIVIRTLVAHDEGTVTLAAGGAIVADSDPTAEYEEMLTKLRAALPPSVGRVVE
ncbi:MAG: anthranilate synthase component I family protein [Rothia sp.]|uniref:anthranilate synthase component I family protein n=1 Tax=Rothia sp. (in: high G+C Gram-positive bacteria) TaxID=1885016 RepID=UPI001CB579EB|nr:anthranilate synthase component I family protein [Rothia sp. (in: high G+C Gram-positive bacteria)]MBF1675725.1 anthranilate synthase component I family protein [Rothia sp. (in: high G+C Gram-positive bacteria)]